MCLIAFQWEPGADLPLVVVANRDEYYARRTAPLAWWAGGRVLAGRDLEAGGTWMGVTRAGRFAALTNIRDGRRARMGQISRGLIARRYLEGGDSAGAFLEHLRQNRSHYDPFNLLLWDGGELLGYAGRQDRILSFTPGLHAVSNGDFDEPWPKVQALVEGLGELLEDDEALLTRLRSSAPCDDDQLPRTGVPIEWERALSPVFVQTPTYGTRASTLLRVGREAVSMLEQRYAGPDCEGRSEFRFQIQFSPSTAGNRTR